MVLRRRLLAQLSTFSVDRFGDNSGDWRDVSVVAQGGREAVAADGLAMGGAEVRRIRIPRVGRLGGAVQPRRRRASPQTAHLVQGGQAGLIGRAVIQGKSDDQVKTVPSRQNDISLLISIQN